MHERYCTICTLVFKSKHPRAISRRVSALGFWETNLQVLLPFRVSMVTCKWTGKVCKTLEVTSNEPASSPGKVLLQHSKWPGPKAANMHRGLEKVKESFFVPLDLQEILSSPGRQAACDWYYTLQAVFEDWQETASRKRNDQQIYQTIPRTNDQWRNFSEIKFMQNDVSWTIETFEIYTSFNLSFFHWSVFYIPW